MAEWIKMPLGMEIGLGPGGFVLDGNGNPAPLPKKGAEHPQFWAHLYCGQMPGWIKMALEMEVGLGPGHTARWRSSSPPQKGGRAPPILGPFILRPNGCM